MLDAGCSPVNPRGANFRPAPEQQRIGRGDSPRVESGCKSPQSSSVLATGTAGKIKNAPSQHSGMKQLLHGSTRIAPYGASHSTGNGVRPARLVPADTQGWSSPVSRPRTLSANDVHSLTAYKTGYCPSHRFHDIIVSPGNSVVNPPPRKFLCGRNFAEKCKKASAIQGQTPFPQRQSGGLRQALFQIGKLCL